jgi:putative protease
VNDEVEFFGPNLENTKFKITEIYDEDMLALEAARHPLQIIKMRLPFAVSYPDMFRMINDKK